MEQIKIKFKQAPGDTFYTSLKEKMDTYFASRKMDDKANGAMIFKMLLIGFLFFGTYAAILSNKFSEGQLLLLALLWGFSKALIAFNISHDASHNALFKSKTWNEVFSYSFNLIGVNRYIWNIKHNVSHHSFTNIPGHDMDIEQIKIARLVPHVPLKWFYRYQHIYVPLLYPFLSLFMLFVKDFQMFATRKYGNNVYAKHPRSEYIILILSKLIYFTYAIVIPFMVLHIIWYKFLLGFVLMHMMLGVLLAIILFPVHALDDSPFPEADENGYINESWVRHEIATSTNFCANSRLMHWISGGLNTHVIHHVFPNICHIHYYELTKIINQTAQEHQIPIRQNTMWGALRSHLNLLKMMGRQKKWSNAK
jgi:linoleoyl-CoA desaturase